MYIYVIEIILNIKLYNLSFKKLPEESSQPRDRTQVSCIAGRFFPIWATREAQDSMHIAKWFSKNIVLNYISCSKVWKFSFCSSWVTDIHTHIFDNISNYPEYSL